MRVAALIDTGSSICVISKDLFNQLPERFKLSFEQVNQEIRLANNSTVDVFGLAKILVEVPQGKREIDTYILPFTSHPLIFGTQFLKENNIVLDFSNNTFNVKSANVKSYKRIVIEANTEMLIWGRLPDHLPHGLNGVCSNTKYVLNKGLIIGKTLVTVSVSHKVPIRILNTTSQDIVIPKGKNLAEFSTLSSEYSYVPYLENKPVVQNMQLSGMEDIVGQKQSESEMSTEQFLKIKNQFNLSSDLTENEQTQLVQCINKNYDIFVTEDNPDIGYTNIVEHKITLKDDAVGKHHKPYRLSPEKRDILRYHLDRLLDQGIITPVNITDDLPISSPIVLVMKRCDSKDNKSPQSFRFCCDFRYLNSQTKDFKYNIPNLQELTESFSTMTPNYMTSIDMSAGFFQMGITQDSAKFTAFNTCFGTYQFRRLPMGLKTSPNTFQMMMDKVLRGLQFKICLCYLDDVLICSETFEQHLEHLDEVFQRFRAAGLKLGPKKCVFAAKSCIYLGHEISKEGIRPPPDRVDALLNIPPPKNIKELRRIVGMFNWFRKFIANFSAIIGPLTRLLKKNQKFQWQVEQQSAFDNLKQCLTSAPFLSFPRYDIQFRLAVDTSSLGIGYMLYQIDPQDSEQKPRIIRYGSKALNSWQSSYGPTKLELLGMVVSVLECSDYLRGNKFVVECDHEALQPLFQKQFKGAIYERWLSLLQQFNFDIQYKPAAEMTLPDALSRCPEVAPLLSESPAEDDPYFPFIEEPIGQIKLPNGSNLCDILKPDINSEPKHVQVIDILPVDSIETNDPYDADTSDVTDNSDIESEIVNRKSKRRRKITNSGQKTAFIKDSALYRQLNMDMNAIKNLQKDDENIGKIMQYIADGTLPESQKESRKLLLEAPDYILIDSVLFRSRKTKSKRTKLMSSYQLVVPTSLVKEIIRLAHDSPLGGHSGINNTIDRIREFFFFPRMGKIITDYVQSCHQCQTRKVSNMKTKSKIVAYPTPSKPFLVWQIDLFGPLPPSPTGNTYIFTAVDMFSKLLFAQPIRNKDVATVSEAIFSLSTTYGVPQTLISDQGQEFVGKCTQKVCLLLGLKQELIPSFIHHCLGACERTHRTIAERLTPYVQNNEQWQDVLPAVIFSINSSMHGSSHYSPFEIVYGQRPHFPLTNMVPETDFTGIHHSLHSYLSDFTSRLKIIHTDIFENIKKSQAKMEKQANEKLHEIKVSVGDYVYLAKEPTGQGQKLKPNFEGPFIVHAVLSNHRVNLRDPKAKRTFKQPVHMDRLKIAHVRAPDPQPFLGHKSNTDTDEHNDVISDNQSESTDSNEKQLPQVDNNQDQPLRRSKRVTQKPIRFRDSDHATLNESESDINGIIKVKRVLAKKRNNGSFLYLVQMVGEPAQNAKWLPISDLSAKVQEIIVARPPPLIAGI